MRKLITIIAIALTLTLGVAAEGIATRPNGNPKIDQLEPILVTAAMGNTKEFIEELGYVKTSDKLAEKVNVCVPASGTIIYKVGETRVFIISAYQGKVILTAVCKAKKE